MAATVVFEGNLLAVVDVVRNNMQRPQRGDQAYNAKRVESSERSVEVWHLVGTCTPTYPSSLGT